jgi:hypothetical protein
MEKKDKKRDIAVFSNMLKDLMNSPMEQALTTLDRDLQHFIYGRVAVLIKHNDDKPIGSIDDIGVVTGAALADVCKEFMRGKVDDSKIEETFQKIKEGMIRGFDIRTPKINSESDQTEKVEA